MTDSSMEHFCPKLRPGKLIPKEQNILYETTEPFDQIVLPIEAVRFLVYCNGKNSIRDIIQELYKEKAGLRFKEIYNMIQTLQERGFFENGDVTHFQERGTLPFERLANYFSVKELFNVYLVKRLFNDQIFPKLFYAISVIISLLGFAGINNSPQLKFMLAYFEASPAVDIFTVTLVASISILLIIKNISKALLLLLITGRVYNLEVVFNGFALYFRAGSESGNLVQDRLYSSLLMLANILIYPTIGLLLGPFVQQNIDIYMGLWAAIFVLLYSEFDPFSYKEFGLFLRNSRQNETLRQVERYFKNTSLIQSIETGSPLWGELLKGMVLVGSFTWGFIGLTASYLILSRFGRYLWTELFFAHGLSRLLAFVLFVFFLAGSIMLFVNIAILTGHFLKPYLKNLKKHYFKIIWILKAKKEPRKHLSPILEDLPIFNYFGPNQIERLIDKSRILALKDGEILIEEGALGEQLFVLLEGRLDVFKSDDTSEERSKVGELLPVALLGEWAFVEGQPRKAEVVATKNSIVLEVPASTVRALAEENSDTPELDHFIKSIYINQFFASAPMFRDLSPETITRFVAKGNIENVPKNKIITKQGTPGAGFYLILRGRVSVYINGVQTSKIGQGGFFGEISALADIPSTSSITTDLDSVFFKISNQALWELFSDNIDMAIIIESVAEKRLVEDIESLEQPIGVSHIETI